MRQKVVALPVGGDAFLLQRDDSTLLIDSGRSGKRLAGSLSKYVPEVERIHIAACTHADEDHAGGFTSLLDHWNPRPTTRSARAPIDQFWLPGTWVDVVPDLLTEAKNFADALVKELEDFATEHPRLSEQHVTVELIDNVFYDYFYFGGVLRQETHRPREKMFEQIEEASLQSAVEFDEPQWMQALRSRAAEILRDSPKGARVLRAARRKVRYRRNRGRIGSGLAAYWLSLIDTADRIRLIALSAIKHGVKVRWFDYDEFLRRAEASGGILGTLIPVNAVEQSPPPSDLSYSAILRLSIQNERCLAFYAQEADWQPGVLFCGDSPMAYAYSYDTPFPLPNRTARLPLLVTAPHHGAESNAKAYGHIRNWAEAASVLWLRSGGTSNHPESTFRTLPPSERLCTHCPHLELGRQPAMVTSYVLGYVPSVIVVCSGHYCSC